MSNEFRFEVGEKVRIKGNFKDNDAKYMSVGEEGFIKRINKDMQDRPYIVFFPEQNDYWYCMESYLAKMCQLNVGDDVITVEDYSPFYEAGKVGVIFECCDKCEDDVHYGVEFDDGESWFCPASTVALRSESDEEDIIEEVFTESLEIKQFKLGYTVRVIKPYINGAGRVVYDIGDIGTIVEIDEEDVIGLQYGVNFEFGYYYCGDEHIELVNSDEVEYVPSEEHKAIYDVGDTVRVNTSSSLCYSVGDVGFIQTTMNSDGEYEVFFPDQQDYWFIQHDRLDLVKVKIKEENSDDKEVGELEYKFKVGDVVIVVQPFTNCMGDEVYSVGDFGTVIKVDKSDDPQNLPYCVQFAEECWWCGDNHIKLLDKPEEVKDVVEDEIITPNSNLQAGDKIIITKDSNWNDYFIGQIGIINYVDSYDCDLQYNVDFENGDNLWVCREDVKLYVEEETITLDLSKFNNEDLVELLNGMSKEIDYRLNNLKGGI